MKVITFDDIKNLNISPETYYEWTEQMIRDKKKADLPPKISLHPGEGIFCNVMPCILPNGKGGVKVVNRYPERNPALDSKLMLLDMQTGDFLAMMDANYITAMRTGAVAAHSIITLAKSDYKTVGMMGLGNMARVTLLILASVVKDRDLEIKLLRFQGEEDLFYERFKDFKNLTFSYADTPEELIGTSDVVVSCVTYFDSDICQDEVFKEGVLIVPVHTRGFTNCDLFFDKVFADDTGHVCNFKNFSKFRSFAEVCDVVNGNVPGRENDKERILAYNIGLSIHDINLAGHIYEMMKDRDDLQEIDLHDPQEKYWV